MLEFIVPFTDKAAAEKFDRYHGTDGELVRCKDCAHCFSLAAVDPMRPYEGGGDGSFYCAAFDMDFYAPHYDAATYYCADGERRNYDGPSD